MAKIPNFKRFTLEDFQDQKSWISKLLDPLNMFMQNTVEALSNGITFQQNVQSQLILLRVQTAATETTGAGTLPDYVELFETPRFRITMKVKPLGFVILSAVDSAANASINPYGVSLDWSYADGLVTVRHVSGLLPSKTYNLVLLGIGG